MPGTRRYHGTPRLSLLLLLLLTVLLLCLRASAQAGDDSLGAGEKDDEADRGAALSGRDAADRAADDDDDDDDTPPLGLSKADVGDTDTMDLSKADLKALRDDLADHSPGKSKKHGGLSASLKSMGLTDTEIMEIARVEAASKDDDSVPYLGKKDKRVTDAAPPQGMVAHPGDRLFSADGADGVPPKPHQPREGERLRALARRTAMAGAPAAPPQPSQHEKELATDLESVRKSNKDMLAQLENLKRTLEATQSQGDDVKSELDRSRNVFRKALDREKQEHKVEKEELKAAIEERKRAFDELYEEKQVLGQILSDEQKTLHELQEKIQHPDLGLWVRQRAERAAILVDTPETDAMKYYARKYMAPKVTKMRHRLELLEKRVEKSVDHLLPSKYGTVVALLLCVGLVGFPMFVTFSTVWSVTKSVSLRQYVLLGNVFLTAFSGGLCIAGLILQQDPLQTLYEASESMFVMLQLATAIAFPIFIGVIFCAVFKARDQEDLFVFGCELVFYVLVGLNYRSRVWRPAMLGENIETSRMMYVVYVIDFLSMTALTISSAKMDRSRLTNFAGDTLGDVEGGEQGPGKVTGVTGSASLASTRSGLTALGSGLMKVARGTSNSGGKEE